MPVACVSLLLVLLSLKSVIDYQL